MEEGKVPKQQQSRQPGLQSEMKPQPESSSENYRASGKLNSKVAIITGGDSGIGRAVAIAFAKEGADIVITYLNEHEDANNTKKEIEQCGKTCVLIDGDVGDETFCAEVAAQTISRFGHVEILVNNAAEQHLRESILDIDKAQLEKTFRTNIFSMFYMVKAVLPHLKKGARIINTTSVTAYKGNPHLLDYSATKGAIVAFTRSLSLQLIEREIYVNAVAPGPIWTPLIPSTFPPDKVADFGQNVPMKRPGQPSEVAPCYVFLASQDCSYMAGQVLHPNGGTIVNG
ncbi:SDR family oxidoreductase [Nitrosovibrio tenuis]|uniref:NAD(P)-dependent dehydrogenase, short-chain alcohol dehydrogenase family n=1 Tax=Nitrosovibrio tenuis TaxID=1233 RepID=A0A1H7I3R8_9PROT|nr:SDR family oxidoreductase [Nitrosovibrio tenuis]SEK57068.1 NAD(P)-dependent dehydrogenase, short-chain alcohol dehydrogenase family [Nitrosovibrio tenuis]